MSWRELLDFEVRPSNLKNTHQFTLEQATHEKLCLQLNCQKQSDAQGFKRKTINFKEEFKKEFKEKLIKETAFVAIKHYWNSIAHWACPGSGGGLDRLNNDSFQEPNF